MRKELLAARDALKAILRRDQCNTCIHEETHRGGTIWEICDQCGCKWADDAGGKPLYCEPVEWAAAESAIAAINALPPPTSAATIPVPRDVAWEFVLTHNADGDYTRGGGFSARADLHAALLTADPTLVDEPCARVEAPPAMTAELLAALREWCAMWLTKDIDHRPLIKAIERAGIVQPRPTDDEIAAARQVIERAGMKVTP